MYRFSLQSPNQILVTPEGNVLLTGIYIKYKKEIFTLSIFNPPETEELDIEKLNVWKCGILLYILLKGSLPNKFKYLYPYSVKDSNKSILFDSEDPTIPFLQRKLLIEMLNEQPEQRLTYNQILHNQWLIGRLQIEKQSNLTNIYYRQIYNNSFTFIINQTIFLIYKIIKIYYQYTIQCIQLDQYLKEFIETYTYLNIRHESILQSFSKFDLHKSQKILLKDLNYIKQVLKNEALILSILHFSESKNSFIYEDCLQQWENEIIMLKIENLQPCFPNQEVKKQQVVNYLQPKRKKYEDGLILSDTSQMIMNLTKDIYQFNEFIQEVQKGIKEKIKDQMNNQQVFIKSEEIKQEFNELLNLLKSDQEYQTNKIQLNEIKQIQQILGNNNLLNLVFQKEIVQHLEQFEKQDQQRRYY